MSKRPTTSLIDITFGEGKYRYIMDSSGKSRCLRNGEEWRDLVGDKMVLALVAEIEELREEVSRLRKIEVEYVKCASRLRGESGEP